MILYQHDCTVDCPWQVVHVIGGHLPVVLCKTAHAQKDGTFHPSTVVSAITLAGFRDFETDPDDAWVEDGTHLDIRPIDWSGDEP